MWAARKLPRDVLCESETHNDHLAHALFLLFLSPFSTNKLFSSTMSIIDNLKEHINHSLVFRIINIIVACFMVIGGVCVILTGGEFLLHGHNNHTSQAYRNIVIMLGFPQFIRGIYCIVFGVMVFVFEFRLPSIITQHVSYMFSFLGRGLCKCSP